MVHCVACVLPPLKVISERARWLPGRDQPAGRRGQGQERGRGPEAIAGPPLCLAREVSLPCPLELGVTTCGPQSLSLHPPREQQRSRLWQPQGSHGVREGDHPALRPLEGPKKQLPQGVKNPRNWCPRSQADGSRRDEGPTSHRQVPVSLTRARACRVVSTFPGSPEALHESDSTHVAALPRDAEHAAGCPGAFWWCPKRDLDRGHHSESECAQGHLAEVPPTSTH